MGEGEYMSLIVDRVSCMSCDNEEWLLMVVEWMECMVCWCGFERMEWWIDNWIEWICMCVDRMYW